MRAFARNTQGSCFRFFCLATILLSGAPLFAQQLCRSAGYIDGIVAESKSVESAKPAQATIERGGSALAISNGMPLCYGDAVVTAANITVRLRLLDNNTGEQECTVWPGTRVELTQPESMYLRIGKIFLALRGRFDVVTNFARLGARGTEFQVEASDRGIDVFQLEGSVEIFPQVGASNPRGFSPLRSGANPSLFIVSYAAGHPNLPALTQAPTARVDRMTHLVLRPRRAPNITGMEENLFRKILDGDSDAYSTTRPDLPSVNMIRTFDSPRQRADALRELRFRTLWNPQNPEDFDQLGRVYADWAEFAKAIRGYEKSPAQSRRGRDLAIFYNDRGNAYRLSGNSRQAEAYYRRSLSIDPQFAFPYNGLGDVFRDRAFMVIERGNVDGALKLLEDARDNYRRSLDPSLWGKEGGRNRAIPLYNLGEAALLAAEITGSTASTGERLRRCGEAEERFREAAAQDSDYPFPMVGIGRVYAARARIYRERGERDREAREIDLGRAHASRVRMENPGFAPARVQLGEMLELAGDTRSAAGEYLGAIRSDPGYAGAYLRAGAALENLGSGREAMAYFQIYLRTERRDLLDTSRARDVARRVEKLGARVSMPLAPAVTGKPEQDARLEIERAGFRIGRILTEVNNAPRGTVLRQQPEGNATVSAGIEIELVVSSGPEYVRAPKLIGVPLDQARAALESMGLRFEIELRKSIQGRPGTVVEQYPKAGTNIRTGSTVRLIAGARALKVVPKVVGLPFERAQETIARAGLSTGPVGQRPDRAKPGTVVAQDPAAGTSVESGTEVSLIVSAEVARPNVKPPQLPPTRVPKLVGMPLERAQEALAQTGLHTGPVAQRSDRAKPGTVVAQDPAAGTSVESGTEVSLIVSAEVARPDVKPTRVPKLVGMPLERAQEALAQTGLRAGPVAQRSDRAKPGTVVAQDPAAGTSVESGTEVSLIVSAESARPDVKPTRVQPTRVPKLVGMPLERAQEALAQTSLRTGPVAQRSDRAKPGTVVAQDPAAGTSVESGTEVSLIVSAESARPDVKPTRVQPTRVPKLVGMPLERAQEAIARAGLRPGPVGQRPDRAKPGTIVAQDPAAGTSVEPGTEVRLTVSAGPPPRGH